MKYSLYLVLFLFSILNGCKDREEDLDPNAIQKKEASIVYEAGDSYSNISVGINASFDGSFLVNLDKVSKDGGKTWSTTIRSADVFLLGTANNPISNMGYYASNSQSNSQVIDIKNFTPVTFSVSGFYKDYYVGTEDYIYCHLPPGLGAKGVLLGGRAQSAAIDTLSLKFDTLGSYAGQDKNGGVAFYNKTSQLLSIHNPTTKRWETLPCNYDNTKVRAGYQDRGFAAVYNGYDKVVIANGSAFAVVDLPSNTATYSSFMPGYSASNSGYQSTVSISKNGEVYATMYDPTNTSSKGFFVQYTPYEQRLTDVIAPVVCSGEFTYIMKHNKAIKKGDTEVNMTEMMTPSTSWGIATISPSHIYYLEDVTTTSQNFNVVDRVTNEVKTYDITTLTNNIPYFKYIYAEGTTIMVSGANGTALSQDNGATWQTGSMPNSLNYIQKIDGTYYGQRVWGYEYYGANSYPLPKHQRAMYTSTDLKNWTLMEGTLATEGSGSGPSSFRSDGLIVYSYNANPQGNQVIIQNISRDFGKSWTVEKWDEINFTSSIPLLDNEKYRRYNSTTNSITLQLLDDFGNITKTVEFSLLQKNISDKVVGDNLIKIGNDIFYASDRMYKLSF